MLRFENYLSESWSGWRVYNANAQNLGYIVRKAAKGDIWVFAPTHRALTADELDQIAAKLRELNGGKDDAK